MVGIHRGTGKINSTIASNKKWIVSGAPLLADIRWERKAVKIPTLQKPHLSSCAPLVFFVAGILFKSRL